MELNEIAKEPIIISVSRATDIPAFYGVWLIDRLKKGYSVWINQFNNTPMKVSYSKARLFVFWSKNPAAFIKHIDFLNDNGKNYYFQYTLNDYDKTLEDKVGKLDYRIETFIKLSEKIGKDKILWRFDPYIMTDKIGIDELLKKTEYIGNRLKNYTNKLIFSFADIISYRKVSNNMKHINYIDFNENSMCELAAGLQKLNESLNLDIATCSEKIELDKYGISHNKCIDDDLIKKLFPEDEILMNYIGYKIVKPDLFTNTFSLEKIKKGSLKDKGQREFCGCISSKDIGQYDTCPHACVYCYANASINTATNNYKKHKENPLSETIKGD